MIRVLTTVILLSIASITSAANWVYVTENNTDAYFLDTSSITHERGVSRAWFKQVIFNDIVKDGRTVGDSTKAYYFFNCTEKTIWGKSYVQYTNGKVSKSDTFDYPRYAPITPDSIGEALYEATCNGVVPPSPFS